MASVDSGTFRLSCGSADGFFFGEDGKVLYQYNHSNYSLSTSFGRFRLIECAHFQKVQKLSSDVQNWFCELVWSVNLRPKVCD